MIDKVASLYQVKWIEYLLSMHDLLEWGMLADLRVSWNKARNGRQTRIWDNSINLMTAGLNCVALWRLPDYSSHNYCNLWLQRLFLRNEYDQSNRFIWWNQLTIKLQIIKTLQLNKFFNTVHILDHHKDWLITMHGSGFRGVFMNCMVDITEYS